MKRLVGAAMAVIDVAVPVLKESYDKTELINFSLELGSSRDSHSPPARNQSVFGPRRLSGIEPNPSGGPRWRGYCHSGHAAHPQGL